MPELPQPNANAPLFSERDRAKVRVLYVGEKLDLRSFETTHRLGSQPLVIPAGAKGCAVLMRYGAVVLFDLDPLEEAAFLKNLSQFITERFEKPEIDETTLAADQSHAEGSDGRVVFLHDFSIARIQLVAEILAKSVTLAYYEGQVAAVFDRIEPLALELQQGGKGLARGKELIRQIGGTLLIQHKMVGRVEVSEKPELLWDRPELERLYLRLEDEYELKERQQALERKLDLIGRTVETLLDLFQSSRTLRLEWYVIILIFIEILLSLYELFFRR